MQELGGHDVLGAGGWGDAQEEETLKMGDARVGATHGGCDVLGARGRDDAQEE